ncbi:ATP-binding protein [Jeongeupia chitinilytica]|uniref:histidine kinase n=1 Tax=Jeongeupia chitinilytica TaxID=1041641 RepID=A0ABQ3H236_9NEIS|nr:ATP-binding protein [Jeongeupia chitinilytica]GHD64747.1 two-component sensor histidine kinase [Jeongeupia chitinilytica]
MTTPPRSLLWRLAASLAAAILLLWVVMMAGVGYQVRHEIGKALDRQLEWNAKLSLAAFTDDPVALPTVDPHRTAFALYDKQGRLQEASTSPPLPLLDGDRGEFDFNGQRWVIRVATSAHHTMVLGEPIAVRDYTALDTAGDLALPMLAVLALLLPLVLWLVWRGLQPVRDFAEAVAARTPERLEPLTQPAPPELAPLQGTLNRLFDELGAAFARERRFTADAAHELRTPLAAVQIQLEVAERARDPERRDRAMTQALAACGRASRLVGQLLALARLEQHGAAQTLARERIDWPKLCEALFAELDAAGVRLPVLQIHAPSPLLGDHALLTVLLRNLIDNARRYGGDGATVTVRIAAHTLIVEDDGPGIDADAEARLGERFFRPVGQALPGAGLGLSIVARIAALHRAEFRAGNGEAGGFVAQVIFPMPA